MEDLWGMFQILLRLPEVVLWPVATEPDQVFWLFVGTDQPVCYNVLHFKLFLVFYQLWWRDLVGWPDFWRAGLKASSSQGFKFSMF